jgi:hypothetical protein
LNAQPTGRNFNDRSPVSLPGYVAGVWSIDPVHSDVSFTCGHYDGVKWCVGEFTEFDAVLRTAPNPLDSHVEATIKLTRSAPATSQGTTTSVPRTIFEVDLISGDDLYPTAVRYDGDEIVVDRSADPQGITRPVALSMGALRLSDPDAYAGLARASRRRPRSPQGLRRQLSRSPLERGRRHRDKVTINIEAEFVLRSA